MSFDPQPYQIAGGLQHWLIVFGLSLGIVVLLGLVLSMIFTGKLGAVAGSIVAGLRDLSQTSGRRVLALAQLTFREAVRRKTLFVFVVFALLFMFAGWFLSDVNRRDDLQIKVYVSFVLTAISWLLLPLMLLLACWALPEDIKARSLHTVVTKPARRSEIVLGRMLGFVGVATVLLVVMGTIGYIWIMRLLPEDVRQEQLVCRVPVYGQLYFLNREGSLRESGSNVGDPWNFRGYVEGATRSRGVYEFEGIEPNPDGLILEAQFEAFRSYKGDMNRGLLYRYEFVNEDADLRIPFEKSLELREFGQNVTKIDREVTYYDPELQENVKYDLFDDLVDNGKLRVEVSCLDAAQYLGMARPDLFIRMPDAPFWWGYVKSIAGIWLLMVMVVAISVAASCFCKGPVAAMVTFTLLIVGQGFREFMQTIVSGEFQGGGPIESSVRIYQHMNPQVPLSTPAPITMMIETVDSVMINGLWLVLQLIPDFDYFSQVSKYVPNGFDVNWQASLLPSLLMTVGFVVPCVLIGYYSLKLRELESK